MKKLIVAILSMFILFLFASALMAQNHSAENSDVIIYHSWWPFGSQFYCERTGNIIFTGKVQRFINRTPSGKITGRYVSIGEGIDEFGGVWKWHYTSNNITKVGENQIINQVWTMHGPKGAQLKFMTIFVERDGEIRVDKFDPICE